MTSASELYRPWEVNGTYMNRMLQCGANANYWIQHALISALPMEVLDEWKDRVVFLSGARSDAFRVGKKLRQEKEIIFIAERIIPKGAVSEDHPMARYLMFAALHELAHVVKQHAPPNEISEDDNARQEKEADELAFSWFNAYVKKRNHPDIKQFTQDELKAAKVNSEKIAAAAA